MAEYAQLTADEFAAWEAKRNEPDAAQERYRQWRRRFEAYLYRCAHMPLMRPLLSERLLVTGPEPQGRIELPSYRAWLMATARAATRQALLRAREAAHQAEVERKAREAALTAPLGAPAATAELLVPSRELVTPNRELEVADFVKGPAR